MTAQTWPAAPRLRRRAGPGGRPPVRVLLLHGMGGGVGNWDALTALLAPRFELWDVRLPWAIGADPAWARDAAVTRWVADPIEQIRRTTGRGPDVVVAHSFAANLVLELLAGPGLLSSTPVILISPFCRGTQADLDWSSVIPSMKRCFARVEEEIRLRRGSRVSDDLRKTMVQRAFELMGGHPPLRFYQVYMRTALLGLEALTTPLLLIGGGDDIAAAVQSVAVLGQRIPPARAHIIDDCGHFPMTERPAEVARLIEEFINGPGRPATPAPSPGDADMISQTPPPRLVKQTTTTRIRPHHTGSNIGSWIGFKHINYLAQEAVLEHLRAAGLPVRRLYEDYGLCAEIVDLGTRIHTSFHLDDLVEATVQPAGADAGSGLAFDVGLCVQRGTARTKAATAKVFMALRHDESGGPADATPAGLAPFTVSRIARTGPAPAPIPVLPARHGGGPGDDGDLVLAALTRHRNAFARRRRIPYPDCHYTERMHMSGYLREMEEVVDLFLADRGVSVKRMLDERGWIPVVPHSSIAVVDEAVMEEELYTVFTVENVYKGFTYAARMDTYVLRAGQLLRTATGHITHGYAEIRNRGEFGLVKLDRRMIEAIGDGRHAA